MQTWDKHLRSGGLLVVVSGPSGVGKDSVLDEFGSIYPEARRCVTATTRKPRKGEVDGVDYHFLTVEDFERKIAEGGFLEHARVHGHLYGTPRSSVNEQTAAGRDVILKIDVQGGIAVKQQEPLCVMVFLVPPSLEELERRLRSRSTETEQDILKRFADARNELEQIPHYDYIIENSSIRTAAEQLKAVLIAEHCRIQR